MKSLVGRSDYWIIYYLEYSKCAEFFVGEHTQAAWRKLFPGIQIVLCFLHAVLGIQQRCRRATALFQKVTGKLWHVYKAPTLRQFAQRLRRLREWAEAKVKQHSVRHKLLNLKTKAAKFQMAYDFPDAYRTSNALDRLMNYRAPSALQHAVFSWHLQFGSIATASYGLALEFLSLQ